MQYCVEEWSGGQNIDHPAKVAQSVENQAKIKLYGSIGSILNDCHGKFTNSQFVVELLSQNLPIIFIMFIAY